MSRLAQSTLTYYLYSSFINGSLVLVTFPPPADSVPVWFRGRGGAGVRVCLHRPCTPRVGNLYSVTRTPESPKGGACHRMQASRGSEGFAGFNPVVVYRSVPGRAVCLSVSVPAWFRGRGGGWCSSLRPCYSSDVMGDAPWQDGCSEDDQASKIFYFPCYRLHGPRRLARWVPVRFGWVSFHALRGREGNLT